MNQTARRPRLRPLVEELEARVLYSADLAPGLTALPGIDAGAEVRALDDASSASSDRQTGAAAELVFIDADVAGWEDLLADIQANSTRRLDVVVLDPARDGIEQIDAALATRHDLGALHVITHGAPGTLQLGATRLDAAALAERADSLRTWGDALTAEADMLIYGCDVAAGLEGQAFVDALGRLTGADVAASTGKTGSTQLGGDWVLESTVGPIEAATLDIVDWQGILAYSSTGTWNIVGNTATNTTAGITTTITLTADSAPAAFQNIANNTLGGIAAFTPAVQGNASLATDFLWDASPEFSGSEASVDAQSGTITISFSQAVTNPILQCDRLGGRAGTTPTNSSILTLLTPGITLHRLSGYAAFLRELWQPAPSSTARSINRPILLTSFQAKPA
ncbi:MAG: DUF4347 domain-containing protein [Hydrogenophilales bacterium]|nr:DUF4347 domain-containing protein [Hydrogenophilales bacterium]